MLSKSHSTPTWLDLLLVNGLTILVILLILFGGGCGIVTGNPEAREDAFGEGELAGEPSPAPDSFGVPLEEFRVSSGSSCGSFNDGSTASAIEGGQQCIRTALTNCTASKYLIDQTNTNGQRFVSFVEVKVTSTSPLSCEVAIHTVSSESSRFVGDKRASCTSISVAEPIELACGIK
jgi:hypothetical protein